MVSLVLLLVMVCGMSYGEHNESGYPYVEEYMGEGNDGYNEGMPLPFYRILYLQSPPFSGNDVNILQNLLGRSQYATPPPPITSNYDSATQNAVYQFQKGNSLSPTGNFTPSTAELLLAHHLYDGYKDNGTVPPGWKYKVYIPVHSNRSIETFGTLMDSKGTPLLTFKTRTHGQDDDYGNALNCITRNGATPTGLATFDLNSPEEDHVDFGPYPINRVVQGLEGNFKVVIQNTVNSIRSGILMHTGEWQNWTPSDPMPNSHGCVHTHPTDCNKVWQILVSLGVEIRPNTFGKLPYPYKPQGLISIEQID